MILRLDECNDLYLNKLRKYIGHCIIEMPCPPRGHCNHGCGMQQFCNFLQAAYVEACQEESKRNGTEP